MRWWHDITNSDNVTIEKVEWASQCAEKNLEFHIDCTKGIEAATYRIIALLAAIITALTGFAAGVFTQFDPQHVAAGITALYLTIICGWLVVVNLSTDDAWPIHSDPKNILTTENFGYSFPVMRLGFVASMQERIEKYRKRNRHRGSNINKALRLCLVAPLIFAASAALTFSIWFAA